MSEITNIKVFPVTNGKSLKANVYFQTGLVSVKARVMSGKNGTFVSLPSTSYVDKETNEKKYADDVKFISKEARKSAEDAILQAYQDKVGGTSTTKTTPSGAKKSSALPF